MHKDPSIINKVIDKTKLAPGPTGHFLWGSLRDREKDTLGFFVEAARDYGDVMRCRFGPILAHLVTNPEHVKYVLQENNRNYNRQTIGQAKMRMLLGQGLITSDGDFWLRQRRIAQPAFHRQKIASFAEMMVKATQDMLKTWAQYSQTNKPLDIVAEMTKVTLRIVGETLLSTDISGDSDKIGEALSVALHYIMDRLNGYFDFVEKLPTAKNRRYWQAAKTLDRVVLDIIAQRRQTPTQINDLLGMLMAARDEETGESMTDQQLRDEVMTIFTAGHETTANALVWTWYLLSQHPQVYRQLQHEIDTVLQGKAPTISDLPKLNYLTNVIKESMRLYPPVWLIARAVIEDDEIGGYYIPAKSVMLVSPYITHRYASVWENPEGFDPERFNPTNVAQLPRFAYFPFGGGPHLCIGNDLAIMEMQLIMATILQHYRLDIVPGYTVKLDALITLRPKDPLWMRLMPRESSC